MTKIPCHESLALDWRKIYNHPIWYLETFVDKIRFTGTCYKAANWKYLGDTTGRGKNDQTFKPNRSIKAVWGYPFNRLKDLQQSLGIPLPASTQFEIVDQMAMELAPIYQEFIRLLLPTLNFFCAMHAYRKDTSDICSEVIFSDNGLRGRKIPENIVCFIMAANLPRSSIGMSFKISSGIIFSADASLDIMVDT